MGDCQVCEDSPHPPPRHHPLCHHQHLCVFACGQIGKESKMKGLPAAHPRPKLFSEQKPHHRASKMGDFFVNPPPFPSQRSSPTVHKQGKWENAVAVALLRILLIAFPLPKRSKRLEESGGKKGSEQAAAVGSERNKDKNSTTVSAYFGPHCSWRHSHICHCSLSCFFCNVPHRATMERIGT